MLPKMLPTLLRREATPALTRFFAGEAVGGGPAVSSTPLKAALAQMIPGEQVRVRSSRPSEISQCRSARDVSSLRQRDAEQLL